MVKIETFSDKKIMFLIFCMALVIRLTFVFLSYNTGVLKHHADDRTYWDFAINIVKQGPLVLDTTNLRIVSKMIGPGLPWIMAIVLSIVGTNSETGWLAVFILNAIASSFLSVMIFIVGKKLFNKKVGVSAGLWSTIYILFIKYCPAAGKDLWIALFLLFVILFVIRVTYDKKWKFHIFILGFLFTYLVHIDERYFAYLPLFFISLIFLNKNWLSGLKRGVAFLIIVLILMLPWTIRNYVVHNNLVILSLRTTRALKKFGYNDEWIKSYDKDLYEHMHKVRFYLTEAQIDSVIMGKKTLFDTGKPIKREQIEAMRDGILPKQFSRLENIISIGYNLWKPIDTKRDYYDGGYRYSGKWTLRHNLTVMFTYGILLPFFLLAGVLSIKRKEKINIFLFSIPIFHTLLHTLFIQNANERYRIAIDPIIIILAFYGIIEIFDKLRDKKSS